MYKVNPGYEQYLSNKKERKVLYLRMLLAKYVFIRSGFLWYNLKGMGFEIMEQFRKHKLCIFYIDFCDFWT